ncbi:hypothetical protein F4780DRAFT_774212 [Xylariomycetidae sp. FL0641]|nr:hypothetical protein F4780DRAFT_774212 [Xylariomycetidae sp. FL0641]
MSDEEVDETVGELEGTADEELGGITDEELEGIADEELGRIEDGELDGTADEEVVGKLDELEGAADEELVGTMLEAGALEGGGKLPGPSEGDEIELGLSLVLGTMLEVLGIMLENVLGTTLEDALEGELDVLGMLLDAGGLLDMGGVLLSLLVVKRLELDSDETGFEELSEAGADDDDDDIDDGGLELLLSEVAETEELDGGTLELLLDWALEDEVVSELVEGAPLVLDWEEVAKSLEDVLGAALDVIELVGIAEELVGEEATGEEDEEGEKLDDVEALLLELLLLELLLLEVLLLLLVMLLLEVLLLEALLLLEEPLLEELLLELLLLEVLLLELLLLETLLLVVVGVELVLGEAVEDSTLEAVLDPVEDELLLVIEVIGGVEAENCEELLVVVLVLSASTIVPF